MELRTAFTALVERIRDEHTFIAYELSARCEYWSWKWVSEMCLWYELDRHTFHRCSFGLTDKHGEPMLNGHLQRMFRHAMTSTTSDTIDPISMRRAEEEH